MAAASDRTIQTFTQFLLTQRRGALSTELDDKLTELVAGVVEHGKQGSLTLTLKFKTTGDGVLSVMDTYATKVPTPPAEPSTFFADADGRISRHRLDQDPLPFSTVQGGDEVGPASAEASA